MLPENCALGCAILKSRCRTSVCNKRNRQILVGASKLSVAFLVLISCLPLGGGCHTAEIVGPQGELVLDIETDSASSVETEASTSAETDHDTDIIADTDSATHEDPHLFLHLDATVEQSVITDDFGVVSQWNDLSPHGHQASPITGNVTYPSAQLSTNGLAGLDFGVDLAELSLLSVSATSELLDFSEEGGAALGNSGITVFVVFGVAELPDEQMYIIGTREDRGSFSIKLNKSGRVVGTLSDTFDAHGPWTAQPGDTIVAGISYEAATGYCRVWDSKNDLITEEIQDTFSDLDAEGDLRLGAVRQADGTISDFRGMIGEVRVFQAALSEREFDLERQSLVSKWGTN